MPIFIILSLILSYIQQGANDLLYLLTTNTTIFIGLAMTLVGLIALVRRPLATKIRYDLFASGALLVWFGDWHHTFQNDAPMFFFFPLYFSFLTVFVTFNFINKRQQIDAETQLQIKKLNKHIALHFAVATFVPLSLLIKSHFLLFPIAMTFFIFSYTLVACVEEQL